MNKNHPKRAFSLIFSLCLLFSSCAIAKPMKNKTTDTGSQPAGSEPSIARLSSIFSASSMVAAPNSSFISSSVPAGCVSSKIAAPASSKLGLRTKSAAPAGFGGGYGLPVCADFLVNVDHRLYLTPTPFYSGNKYSAEPGQLINKEQTYYQVARIKGEEPGNAVCVKFLSNGWLRFPFLCEDKIILQGRVYHFTDGSTGNLYYADASLTDKSEIKMVSTAPSNVSSSSSQSDAVASTDTTNDYTLQIILYPNNCVRIPAIKNKVIGKIPGGTVWSLNEIDPSQAIAIQAKSPSGDMWLLATKQVGYTGKTVVDVLTEKGGKIGGVY